MAVNKQILNQYMNEKQEIKALEEKEQDLERKILKIEQEISQIEKLHIKETENVVLDMEIQGFQIEDDYFRQWDDNKIELELKKKMLLLTKLLLQKSEVQLILRQKQVEEFISTINDSMTRRILRYRFMDGLTWREVAQKIGGGNTENGVKTVYHRFIGKM